jgi:outer membrane protein
MKKLLLPVLAALTLMHTAVAAQDTVKLSFEEAVKIGLKNNMTLNQQRNLLLASHAQKLGSVGNFIPGVNFSSSWNRQIGQQQNGTSGELEDLTTDQVNIGVNANWTIPGWGRLATFHQNDRLVSAQVAGVKQSSQDVVYNVASQYLQVLLDQELLRIAEENYTAQKALLDKIQATYDVGARAITDVHAQDALTKAADVARIRARNTLQNDKAVLAQTIQLDPAANYKAVYPNLDQDYSRYQEMPLDSLIAIGLANRADLRQAEFIAQANRFAVRAQTARLLPTLSLSAGYGSFYYSEIPLSFEEQIQTRNPSTRFGASLTIPIFNQFQTHAQRFVSKVTYDNSVLTQQNLQTTVKLDVQRAYNNYINAIEGYNSSLSQFQSGELALQTQQESYLLGVTDQAALAQANQTYVQGAASKVQAQVTLLFQKVLLEYALGVIREDEYTGQAVR